MTRPHLVAVTAVLAALTFSACSAESLVESAAERSIENAGGGDADIDLDLENGGVSVDTEDGSFSTGTSLPDDFPDDIPLVDGEVLSAASADDQGQQGYLVLLAADGTPEEAGAEAAALLEGAGFEAGEDFSQLTDLVQFQFVNDAYDVLVSAYDGGGQATLQYTISVS